MSNEYFIVNKYYPQISESLCNLLNIKIKKIILLIHFIDI